jgi:hypothetical protein
LGWFENVFYHINANVRKMGRSVRYLPGEQDRIKDAKKKIQQAAKEGPLHIKLDQPILVVQEDQLTLVMVRGLFTSLRMLSMC